MPNTPNANPEPVTNMHAWKGTIRYQINYCGRTSNVTATIIGLIPTYLTVRNGILNLTQLLIGQVCDQSEIEKQSNVAHRESRNPKVPWAVRPSSTWLTVQQSVELSINEGYKLDFPSKPQD